MREEGLRSDIFCEGERERERDSTISHLKTIIEVILSNSK
jgi:hypothetical protein